MPFRVVLGLRPTHSNKGPSSPPRKRGCTPEAVDSRLRGLPPEGSRPQGGSDVVEVSFERAKRGILLCVEGAAKQKSGGDSPISGVQDSDLSVG
jgi:hypothetical protein